MLRMTASDPLFPEWNELLTLYAAYLNAACHVDIAQYAETMPLEWQADVAMLRGMVEDTFEELTR
jgi:hypothetical protein